MEEELNTKDPSRKAEEDDDQVLAGEGNETQQNGEENLHSVSISWKSERESLEVEIDKGYERKVEEVRIDLVKGSGENTEFVNSSRKKRKVDSGEIEDESNMVVEIVKKEITDDKVQGGGRILRSRFAAKNECGSVTDSEVNNSNIVVQNCKSSRYGKKRVKLESESNNQLLIETQKFKRKRGRPPKEKNKEANELVGRPRKMSKCKPGRPPKLESENSRLFVSGSKMKLKRKRGRPRKVEQEIAIKKNVEQENDNSLFEGLKNLKRKPGRPPKLRRSNGALKDEHTVGRKVSWTGKLDLKLRNRVKCNVPTDCLSSDKRRLRKEMNMKRTLPVESDLSQKDLEPEVALTSSKVITCSDKLKEVKQAKKVGRPKIEEEHSRSAAKHLLRERITEILQCAGWTIEYRPRSKREYKDAVYVSPEGRTHWSITLAYKVLKKHYEEGDGDSKIYKTGFIFTPIPEEEFMILTRITKARKKKEAFKRQGENGKIKRKGLTGKRKCNEKASSLWGPVYKSIKRKMKGNTLLHELENSDHSLEKEFPNSLRNPNQRKTQNGKRCALLVRNAVESINSYNDGYLLYNGKRTLLAWMIDLGILSLDEKVQYMNQRRTRVNLEGRITRDGIHCNCCGEVITISKFEMHAGSRLDQPLENIYVQTGASLLQCLLESWNKQNEPQCRGYHFVDVDVEDPNDDTCGICGDGGDLICCDSCPSTFHQSCLDIKKFPSGHWHCLYCSCKSCGQVTNALHLRDDYHEAAAAVLNTCGLCEEKFHPVCVQANDASGDDVSSPLFCGKKCQMLHERLQMLLGVKHNMEEGFSWTLVHRSDIGSDVSPCSELAQKIKCNSKLAVALLVMDECFLPIIDHRSGINLIHNILYNCGSNFHRLNYSGFYTVILEKDEEIICAASLRIHGNELAEMPFIGTRYMYRRQGMCRRFLSAIEMALSSLNVEKLVIPAIFELRDTWTSVFGFKPLEEASKKRMRNMNLLVFPGVEMLQKSLLKDQLPTERMLPAEGLTSSLLAEHQTLKAVASSPEERCSPGSNLNACSKDTACDEYGISDELAVIESSFKLNNKILNDTSDLDSHSKNVIAYNKDILHNLEERNKNYENSLRSSCDTACGEAKEVGQYQNITPGSIVSDPDEGTLVLNAKLNQDRASAVHQNSGLESPPCLFKEGIESVDCQVIAEVSATNDKLKFTHDGHVNQSSAVRQNSGLESPRCLSKEGTESVDCQVTAEVSAPNDKLKFTHDGHVNQSSEGHQNSGLESLLCFSKEGTESVDCQVTAEVSASNDKLKFTHDGHVNQMGTISTHHPQETAFVHDGKMVCFSSEIANGCHATLQMDGIISSPSQGDRLNAHVVSTKVCSNCHTCGMLPEADEQKEVTTGLYSNLRSPEVDIIPDSVQMNNFSKQFESGSQINTCHTVL